MNARIFATIVSGITVALVAVRSFLARPDSDIFVSLIATLDGRDENPTLRAPPPPPTRLSPPSPPQFSPGPSLPLKESLAAVCAELPSISWPFLYPPGLAKTPWTDTVKYRLPDKVSILDAQVDLQNMNFGNNFQSIIPLVAKISQQKTLHVLTLGGSVPFGNNCVEPSLEGKEIVDRECSWPTRFATWLKAVFPKVGVLHTNHAEGGVSTPVISNSIGSLLKTMESDAPPVDLLILDAGINDIWRNNDDLISQSHEALLHIVHELSPNTLPMFMVNHCVTCTGRSAHTTAYKNGVLKIAKHYKVPVIDFELVTQSPRQWEYGPIPGGGVDENHPSWHTHQRMADAAAMLWGREMQLACAHRRGRQPAWELQHFSDFSKTTVWPVSKLQEQQGCKVPLSVYSAQRADGSLPEVISGDWNLFEDRKGKPGWITKTPGAKIGFKVTFGPRPQLFVVYLRSYEHIGRVNVTLAGTGFNEVLDGHWQTKVSQSDLAWLSGPDHRTFASVSPNSTYILKLDFLKTVNRTDAKFKVMQVISC